ncbi:type II secretion system protein GspE [Candidatus Collierbacteria bacterium CG17_big_fil_post_rev_8_21_14_2_50_45_7]|uniref:Type II secretion system protein GspE n=2 Tax=Candidatus Collieribacteriota TaxID=1752725 RepID=A0A2H0WY96_9BACT|nr:MAG: type II secretion system protein GspE [Candidatus Collierbacteria bacterium CG09_land_8_20_14_0_10_46_12]PIW08079.1 MAG: type II secretion system protein GspE [Candidatus Collierbacteria bacterium CG17_big_fil_post_rev_8_21_14_2_50_45_7]
MQDLALILKKDGLLSEADFARLASESYATGVSLDELIEKSGVVEAEALVKAKAKLYNVSFVSLNELASSPEALAMIPESVAEHYLALPFGYDTKTRLLSVAMKNPLDLQSIAFLEAKSGAKVKPFMAMAGELVEEIPKRYSQGLSAEVSEVLKESVDYEANHRVLDVQKIGDVIREAPIAKIVATILEFAVKARASDVHIEPLENHTRVRYRIDGILQEKLVLPRKVHEAVVSRIKILAELKIDERRLPQDGRFSFRSDDQEVDLRVSSLPTVDGEKIVMRLLRKTSHIPSLADLGLRGMALKIIEESIKVPHGIVLITGPTGSGKTTTLYSVLHILNTPKVNIVTLEDPVEYQIDGVNQVQINTKAGLSFATGLRSFLRQDPNIIMVGEIRDNETADLAIQASLTGHLVFSTLHTNSSSGALPRLLDMKAEPFLLASSMTCVVAQRVLRKICDNCRESYTPSPIVIEEIKKVLGPLYDAHVTKLAGKPVTLSRGRKCEQCADTGYKGRMAIFEVLKITEKIGKLILERAPATQIEDVAVGDGMVLMEQDGYIKALEGVTTLEEVMRVAKT